MRKVAGSGTVAYAEPDEPVYATATGRGLSRHLEQEERRYSWLEDYLERLKGKEARQEYYALLEHALLEETA